MPRPHLAVLLTRIEHQHAPSALPWLIDTRLGSLDSPYVEGSVPDAHAKLVLNRASFSSVSSLTGRKGERALCSPSSTRADSRKSLGLVRPTATRHHAEKDRIVWRNCQRRRVQRYYASKERVNPAVGRIIRPHRNGRKAYIDCVA